MEFYGVEGRGWFLSLHCFSNYVKVAFFRGTSLRPVPPGESRQKEARYLYIHQDDELGGRLRVGTSLRRGTSSCAPPDSNKMQLTRSVCGRRRRPLQLISVFARGQRGPLDS